MIVILVPRATRSGQAQLGRDTIEWKLRRVFRQGVASGARVRLRRKRKRKKNT